MLGRTNNWRKLLEHERPERELLELIRQKYNYSLKIHLKPNRKGEERQHNEQKENHQQTHSLKQLL